jgi:hypothetical protein
LFPGLFLPPLQPLSSVFFQVPHVKLTLIRVREIVQFYVRQWIFTTCCLCKQIFIYFSVKFKETIYDNVNKPGISVMELYDHIILFANWTSVWIAYIFLSHATDNAPGDQKYPYLSIWVPWLITTGSELDDWIYWHFYYSHS